MMKYPANAYRMEWKAIILLLMSMSLPMIASGQATVTLSPIPHVQFLSNAGIPLANGCVNTYIAGTTTPQTTYKDSGGVNTNTNPIILNAGGFADIWLDVTKSYKFTVVSAGGVNCSTGVTQWTVDNITVPSISALLSSNNTWTGNQTFNGSVTYGGSTSFNTLTLSGALTANGGGSFTGTFGGNRTDTGNNSHTGTEIFANINGTVYIGGSAPQIGGSPDIGSQINAAYSAMPSTGGRAIILPKTGGGCYDYSTPVLLNTSGKYMSIEGLYTANQVGGINQGVCLNYTPTTATTAFTIDYTPAPGGGYTGYPALSNVVISNNSCITVGGCGSSATGLVLGVSNGAHFATLRNVKVSGFSTGITIGVSNGWGQLFEQVSAVYNATGFTPTVIMENVRWVGGTISVNGTGISCPNNSGLTFDSVSFDANSVVALNNANCNVAFIAPWFENSGVSNAQYITQSIGQFTITGGFILDDNNSGTIAQHITITGGFFEIHGLNVFSSGQTVTNLITNTTGGNGIVQWFAISPSLTAPGTTATCTKAYNCQVTRILGNTTPFETPVLSLPFAGGGDPSCSGLGGITNLIWNKASTNRVSMCNNGGSVDNVLGAATTDTITNKTVGDKLPFTETTAPSGAANQGILWGGSDDHMMHYNPNNTGVQQIPISGMVTSTYTNATTTPSNITGLSFAVAANRNYSMDCNIFYQGSATTAGLDITITGPASPTSVIYGYEEHNAATTITESVATAFGTKLVGGTITATTNFTALVIMGLRNGANSGTVQVQGSATGVGTVTIQPGSYCQLQ